jgi:quercetin dioxygenase-like cupin family protein
VITAVTSVTRMDELRSVEAKSLGSPDAEWSFLDESERVAVRLGHVAIGRGVYQPGWRWSQHVQPLSGQESEEHVGYVISGSLAIRAKDGREVEVGPGDAFIAAPGHDAWVLGDEPCVALDFIPTTPAANCE